jgi:hypothetical protein
MDASIIPCYPSTLKRETIENATYSICAKILFWLILASNYAHLQWLMAQYTGDFTAHLMTAVVEIGLGVKTYELIRRVTENTRERHEARKRGTKEENIHQQPTLYLWVVVLALGSVSALGNVAYFFERGQPVKLLAWSGVGGVLAISVVLGIIAPCLTAVFAFGEGEKIAIALFLEERKREKERRRQNRLSKRLSKQASNGQSKPVSRRKSKEETRRAILDAFAQNPFYSVSDLAGEIGCARQTVYNYLAELETEGLIRRNGGQGVEVLDGR